MTGTPSGGAIQVSILGRDYYIKGGESPDRTRDLAALVDQKMNIIARQVTLSDHYRIAVLTALHLADEYDVLREQHEELQKKIVDKADRLEKLFDGLAPSAGQPAL